MPESLKLSDTDRSSIEGIVFDAAGAPRFEPLKACLVWPDELPATITTEGRQYLHELLVVRSLMHQDRDPRTEYPKCFATWLDAQASGLRWPGFLRVELAEADRAFLASWLAPVANGWL